MDIVCTPVRKIFPPAKEDTGYMVVEYEANARSQSCLPDPSTTLFKAVGFLLPYANDTIVTLRGDQWVTDANGRRSFQVMDYTERVLKNTGTIAAWLETLPGCDQTIAKRIMTMCPAPDTLDMLDEDDSVFESAAKPRSEQIRVAYRMRRSRKDAAMYLHAAFPKMSFDDIGKVVCNIESLDQLKSNPFLLTTNCGLPFSCAKKMAGANGVPVQTAEGAAAAILDVLSQAEGRTNGKLFADDATGNTYTGVPDVREHAAKMLGMEEDRGMLNQAIVALVQQGKCTCVDGRYLYRKPTCDAEYGIRDEIKRITAGWSAPDLSPEALKYDVYGIENKLSMRLAPEQRAAVKTAMTNAITLLIGGPGTGKTTIEKVILQVYRKHHPTDDVLLIAPTGKAARRMSESTGEKAVTGHRALNVCADKEIIKSDVTFNAGLILIDEASMCDSQLFWALLKATKEGTQIVIVGDTNQLPSIGAGNILFELIASGAVAVARLETVYRQKAGSTIAVNCARIKSGYESLEYEEGVFEFEKTSSQDESVAMVKAMYTSEMERGLSVDDICILTPYRRSTQTGTDNLNAVIQAMVIDTDHAPYLKYGSKRFYVGDKIICSVNENDVSNGDVGIITAIDKASFKVDFGDGRVLLLQKSALKNYDLAYAITIHRSQGSEYKTCIILCCDEHSKMLKRNLLYTAVSRAKTKVILIGTSSALSTAIRTEEVTKRKSRLAAILKS